MKAVILAGGIGSRLSEETALRPKPMVEVGRRPLLWHIMKIYAGHGVRDFVICLGYKAEVVKDYFLQYHYLHQDLGVSLSDGAVRALGPAPEEWTVTLADTGPDTQTGGRLLRVKNRLDARTFFMTYGDGVADINIDALLDFHRRHGRLATLTAVRPTARFGNLALDGDRVAAFREKSQPNRLWVNGGFFVLEPAVLDYIEGDETVFEREPLERLSADGQLMAYRHPGFWQCMDTLQEMRALNHLWDSGRAPWKIWA